MDDKSFKEMLPYFNMETSRFQFSSINDKLPLQNVDVYYLNKRGSLVELEDKSKKSNHESIGHVFPNSWESMCKKNNDEDGARILISGQLVTGEKVSFIYGNGINGIHLYKKTFNTIQTTPNWICYSECNKNDIAENNDIQNILSKLNE